MGRRAPAIAAVVGVAVLALVAVFAFSPQRQESDPGRELIGGLAPELAGDTMDGQTFDIDDHRGQWVLVNFFATWCPPCVKEHPELISFSERNAGSVQVVSVAFDESDLRDAERFFAEKGGDWPVITSETRRASLDYRVKKLPESFLVDPSGVVVEKINGGVTVAQLERTIARHASASAQGAEAGS